MTLRQLLPNTLQMRMLLLVTALVLLVILLTGSIFTRFLSGAIEEQIGRKALMISETVASIPELREALIQGDPEGRIQRLAEAIRVKTGAEFIVVGDSEGLRYSHPNPERIGQPMVGGDNAAALKEGKSYISRAIGTLGPSIRGKTPILAPSGAVVGVVSVGYLLEDINDTTRSAQIKVAMFLPLVLMFGIGGAVWLASSFKKAIFGLEPQEIAGILMERTAILESIRSGIVATDERLQVTLVNHAAVKTLGLASPVELLGQPVAAIFPDVPVAAVLSSRERQFDREYLVAGVRMVFNLIPIVQEQRITGMLTTFRRKDEIDILTRELSSAKQYSDILRAQTHEFSNKLHTIAGLIQLESYAEALDLIVREDNQFKDFVSLVTRVSGNPIVSALILGKFSHAQEIRVEFRLDPQSRFLALDEEFPGEKLVTVIGNLLDNAFEAAREAQRSGAWVELRLDDRNGHLTIRVEDSGRGIAPGLEGRLFQRGVSGKGQSGRGVGLYLVAKCLEDLGGSIRLERGSEGGAVFTATIPLLAKE